MKVVTLPVMAPAEDSNHAVNQKDSTKMSARRIVRVTPRTNSGFDVTLWLYDSVNKKEKVEDHKFVATDAEAKSLKRRWLGVESQERG